MSNKTDEIIWKLPTGKTVIITPDSPLDKKIRILTLARRTLEGSYPSINSEKTIDKLITLCDE